MHKKLCVVCSFVICGWIYSEQRGAWVYFNLGDYMHTIFYCIVTYQDSALASFSPFLSVLQGGCGEC